VKIYNIGKNKMSEEKKEFTYEMLMESFAESRKEIAEIRELQKKSSEESDKEMKKLRQAIGGIAASNGAMAEESVFNAIGKDKTFAGIKFDDMHKNVRIMSGFETKTELDILMLNGDTVSLIETKYKVEKKDVVDLINKKLAYFRQIFPKYDNHKIILGIGGMSFEDNAEEVARENGIGIIKISGNKIECYTDGIRVY